MQTILIEDKHIMRQKSAIPLLWIAIVAIIMLFAAFTSAYVVSRESTTWLHFDLPQLFYISTALIIVSSASMNWALASAKQNKFSNVKLGVLITLLLGLGFVIFQYLGWKDLYSQKIVFAGRYSNPAGSYLYIITFIHVLHLLAGLIALLVVYFRAKKGKYSVDKALLESVQPLKAQLQVSFSDTLAEQIKETEKKAAENLLGIRLCAIYWHFLDALWVYLFVFLLFVR